MFGSLTDPPHVALFPPMPMAAARRNVPLPSPSSESAVGSPALEVRAIASLPEYHACVALQDEVWGEEFESVPASLLQVATYVGGLCLGAFTPDGELCGFVFGLAGTIDGRPTHWSHLLGVKEAARNLGVGRLLKEHQRQVLASRGIPEMCWTFDPLIAKNAHLNLNLLGARVVRYVPDMYGTTESPLHHGLATDRLLVSCPTARPAHAEHAARPTDFAAAPVLTPAPQPGDDVLSRDGRQSAALRIEVPTDFRQLATRSPATAIAWHGALRGHFLWALGAGYVVTGLHRDPLTSRSFYTLKAS
jgi:predicted GNAT superfamily acetyltransferase